MNLTSQPHPVGKVKLCGDIPQFPYIPFWRGSIKLIKIIIKLEVSRQADPMSKEFRRMSANKTGNRGWRKSPVLIGGAIRDHNVTITGPRTLSAAKYKCNAESTEQWSCKKLIVLFIQYYESYPQTLVLVFPSGRSLHHSLYKLFVCSNLFALKISEILRLTTEAKIADCSQMQWVRVCDSVKYM